MAIIQENREIAPLVGLVPMPLSFLLLLAGILASDVFAAEFAKFYFYKNQKHP